MFGFLNPRPHSADYRRAYARLCQQQRRCYGIWSLPFHSYEAVFLYQLALDAGAFPAATMPHVRCCKLACPTSLTRAPDRDVGRFCASVALLLGSIKLEDDIRDQRGLLARAAKWVLRQRIRQTHAYFATLEPRFAKNIQQLIADHHHLETSGATHTLDAYTEPTALSFGYVFGLMARLPNMATHRATLTAVGRKLGAAIIAFDCAVDWRRDRRRGEYNPLPDEAAVHASMAFAIDQLAEAELLVRDTFGTHARSAATLCAVRQRLLRLNPLVELPPCPTHQKGFFARAKQAARFVMLPVAAANTPANDGEQPTYDIAASDGLPNGPDGLPGGIETQGKQPAGRKRDGCCSDPNCCMCGAQSCDCGGACAGADCCAGAECCACAA